ncbi:hypothetical protein ALC60_12766 [Trachymyrmex zeteki]|uniref:Uncharacterized protein n=1 Tax=Mycetomoellerius zeteki TaxID=64791 RepID=A0A151WK21_9HYME|nr:hypothetical protein ALC60_12766 [Trachymyrmex zeteki]
MFDHCCGLGSLKLSAVFGNRYLISFVAGSCVMSAALCNSAAICAMSYYKTHVSLMDRLLSIELQADVTHNYFLSSVVTSRTYSSLANGMVNASPSTMQYSENSSISPYEIRTCESGRINSPRKDRLNLYHSVLDIPFSREKVETRGSVGFDWNVIEEADEEERGGRSENR